MKSVVAALVFGFSLAVYSMGQPPPSAPPPSPRQGPPGPPPPPMIYSSPIAGDVKEFTPESKLFTATFPGTPSEQKRSSGEASIHTYRVYRKGSNSFVAITETITRLSDRTEEVFRSIREGIVEQGGKIESETKVKMDVWPGLEFNVLNGYVYRRVRVFIVGARLFEIQSDVTNWHIIGDKVKAEWNKDTDRFFESFKIN